MGRRLASTLAPPRVAFSCLRQAISLDSVPLVSLRNLNFRFTTVIGRVDGLFLFPLRVSDLASDCDSCLIEILARSDVEFFAVTASECEIGDDIFWDGNAPFEFALWGDDVDACRNVIGFMGASRRVDSGGNIEIAIFSEPHAVGSPTWSEIPDLSLIGWRAFWVEIELPDLSIPPWDRSGINDVELAGILANRDAVRALNGWLF